jgi:hypothetical protein
MTKSFTEQDTFDALIKVPLAEMQRRVNAVREEHILNDDYVCDTDLENEMDCMFNGTGWTVEEYATENPGEDEVGIDNHPYCPYIQ